MRHQYVTFTDSRRGEMHVALAWDEMDSTFVVMPYIEADDRAPREVVRPR